MVIFAIVHLGFLKFTVTRTLPTKKTEPFSGTMASGDVVELVLILR